MSCRTCWRCRRFVRRQDRPRRYIEHSRLWRNVRDKIVSNLRRSRILWSRCIRINDCKDILVVGKVCLCRELNIGRVGYRSYADVVSVVHDRIGVSDDQGTNCSIELWQDFRHQICLSQEGNYLACGSILSVDVPRERHEESKY